MSIVSVKVARRPITIKPGMHVWDNHAMGINMYRVTSEVYKSTSGSDIDIFDAVCIEGPWYNINQEQQLFPGDLGMPGYEYDARPCTLFLSRHTAELADGVYFKWLARRGRHQTLNADYE